MFRLRLVCLLLAALLIFGAIPTLAAEVDCDTVYCYSPEDFPEEMVGICITELPDPAVGTVMLGTRVLRPGDILTAESLTKMTFLPLRTQEDKTAQLTYLPIYENAVKAATTMSIAVLGKEDKAPVAQDFTLETYKNLPNQGKLKVADPEGEKLTYTVVRSPRRGELTVSADGSFLYTPKKNKVGVDSFTYTATDPAGNVSREATVTIQILKPTDSSRYTDTVGLDCRFEAEWLRNAGLFVGESIGDAACFQPEKPVSRGDFLAMVVKALDIPVEGGSAAVPEDTPQWLKPYLAAAMRSGLTAGWPQSEDGSFDADAPITGAEAAVMLQNVLDLTISQQTLEQEQAESEEVPAWAQMSLTALKEYGIDLPADKQLQRQDVAETLYQVSILALDAPGMAVIRRQ